MPENQTELINSIHENFSLFRKLMPEVGETYDELPSEAYKDGELSGKVKRLMALSAALTHGCRGCILFQTERALNLGASVREILESCAVAVSLGGTMAAAETTRVVALLREKGLIDEEVK
jgi:AhpD family alkylhydroperoxidase